MVRFFFILMIGFILGALVLENKALYTDKIAQPVAFLPDGGKYDGKLRKGVFDGLGLIIWPYGDRYEGEFKAGLYHGKGRLETVEMIYEGDFFEGAATGEAVIRFADGREYQGEVEAGQANGVGLMTTANATYEGGFKNNLYHGEGTLIEKTGRRYDGFFEQGVFSGEGKLVDDDGSVHQGEFANGQLNGKGFLRRDVINYEGEFKGGVFHGEGIYRDGVSEYVGDFENGQFDGTGRYLSREGALYQGEFKKGQFSGEGVLVAQGVRYEGGFLRGLKEGKGILIFPEPIEGQERLSGVWRADVLVQSDQPNLEFDNKKVVETYLYSQQQRLRQALLSVVDQDPFSIDLYFLGVSGDGRQEIFRRDVEWVRALFDQQYKTQQRSMLLVNSRHMSETQALATSNSIEVSLRDMAKKMDPDQDVLFLLLSGHTTRGNEFYLEQPGFDLEHITADALGELLKSLPIKNKIVMVSSCFAGGFVKPLKDDNTMIIVTSAEDKKIFNCGGYRQNSEFIKIFFDDHFSESLSFYQAFGKTRDDIAMLENQLGYVSSEPLIFRPKSMSERMDRWRDQFTEIQ